MQTIGKSLDGILAQLQMKTGIDNVPQTEEERVKFRCDTYNAKEAECKDGYDCPLCKNKQLIAKPKEINGYWEEVYSVCECDAIRQKRNAMFERLQKSGLMNVFREKTFDKYNAPNDWQKHIKATAINYAKNPAGAWFFIGGQSGAGKSHLCTAIAGVLIKKGKSVQYMLWMDDSRRLKHSSFDDTEQLQLMEQFKKADVLYIDDLFKTGNDANGRPVPPTAADIRLAVEIINYRTLDPNLLTIISSEWTMPEIVGFDQALGGRITELTFDYGYGININRDVSKNYRLRNMVSI